MLKLFLKNKDFSQGFIFGLILITSILNSLIVPILFLYILMTTNKFSIKRKNVLIVLLLLALILWISFVSLLLKHYTINFLLTEIFIFVVFSLALFLKKNEYFLLGLAFTIFILFYVDISFNISTLITGHDLLGRSPGMRPDDFITRLGGIMFHPFYSINISFLALFFSIYFNYRYIFLLSIVNILANGSIRGTLMLCVFFVLYIVIKNIKNIKYLVLIMILIISFVFSITIFSIQFLGEESGNFFRVIAWINAIENIYNFPTTGAGPFTTETLKSVNIESIKNHGIAESAFLHLGLFYGIFPMFMYLFLYISILFQNRNSLVGNDCRKKLILALVSFAFVDAFYGTFIGSVLTTFIFGLLVFSLNLTNDRYVSTKRIRKCLI